MMSTLLALSMQCQPSGASSSNLLTPADADFTSAALCGTVVIISKQDSTTSKGLIMTINTININDILADINDTTDAIEAIIATAKFAEDIVSEEDLKINSSIVITVNYYGDILILVEQDGQTLRLIIDEDYPWNDQYPGTLVFHELGEYSEPNSSQRVIKTSGKTLIEKANILWSDIVRAQMRVLDRATADLRTVIGE